MTTAIRGSDDGSLYACEPPLSIESEILVEDHGNDATIRKNDEWVIIDKVKLPVRDTEKQKSGN